MAGDYRSKKEVAYLLVPAIGFKIIDLGGDVEKGKSALPRHIKSSLSSFSSDTEIDRQLDDS